MTALRILLVAALGVGAAGHAAAEPTEPAAPRLIAPARRIVVHALLEVSLSKDAAFEPVSLAPDVWYGATPRLTVGVVHSGRALAGILGGVGDALCLTGEDAGCDGAYDRAGLLARFHVVDGPVTIALDGGVIARGLDPFTLSLKLGVAARWQRGKLAAELVPNLWLGVTERDAGNVERMNVPLALTYAIRPRLAVAGQLAMIAPFEDFRDEVVIATSVGVQMLVGDQLLVDVAFSLPHWLDTDRATYGLDQRTVTVGVGRAF